MSKFLKHSTDSIFRRKCLHREHTTARFIFVIVGIKCYKCNLFDIHINDGLHTPLRITSNCGADRQEQLGKSWAAVAAEQARRHH